MGKFRPNGRVGAEFRVRSSAADPVPEEGNFSEVGVGHLVVHVVIFGGVEPQRAENILEPGNLIPAMQVEVQ